MPKETFTRWLERLLSFVKPDGYFIFTTHGLVSTKFLHNVKFDKGGYWFQKASEQTDLDTSEYGLSCTLPEFVCSRLFEIPECRVIYFQEAFWWQHQDVYVVQRDHGLEQKKILQENNAAGRILNKLTRHLQLPHKKN